MRNRAESSIRFMILCRIHFAKYVFALLPYIDFNEFSSLPTSKNVFHLFSVDVDCSSKCRILVHERKALFIDYVQFHKLWLVPPDYHNFLMRFAMMSSDFIDFYTKSATVLAQTNYLGVRWNGRIERKLINIQIHRVIVARAKL